MTDETAAVLNNRRIRGMRQSETELFPESELQIYSLIARSEGMRAREIARTLGMDKTEISRLLVSSALMRELCYQDREYRWHALVRQQAPYDGLYEFSGWYGTVREFMDETKEDWLRELEDGCGRIGRSLSDTRGLIHSFTDCRETMRNLFTDIRDMSDLPYPAWEIAFELRFNLRRRIRIYADVLVIAGGKVFSLEFKMKNRTDPEEVLQAAKYVPYLEVLFGKNTDVYPALVLTGASELFEYVPIGKSDYVLPVCSGDMLFNVFNEYFGFLR